MARRKAAKQEEKKPEEQEFGLPLDWQIPDTVPTHRVTNAVIQRSGDEFILSFFEQRGPILLTEDDRKKAMQLESAKALCVARISITPERMESFIHAFKENLDRYAESKKDKTT